MKWREKTWALTFALALSVTGTRVQAQQSTAPDSPIVPPSVGAGGSSKAAAAARGVSSPYDPGVPSDPTQAVPDNNTLSGAQLFGAGSLAHVHNVFDPSVSVSELGNAATTSGSPVSYSSTTLFNALLNFNRNWSINRLTILYDGGGTYSSGGGTYNTSSMATFAQFHSVSVVEQIDKNRWRIILRDDFRATPGAAFTGTGAGGPGLIAQLSSTLGSALVSVGQSFSPNESIQTGNSIRYMDMALGEADYSFSRRTAVSLSGSYGLLHFPNSGYISSQMVNAQAGYNYLLDPKDVFALVGGYGKIDFAGSSNTTADYTGAIAFGRKVTGRLALQAQAGAQQVQVTSANGNYHLWLTSVNSALTYEKRRSGVSLTYMRGLTGGSGAFLGADSSTITANLHHQFTRFWTGTASGGYATNTSLAPAGGVTTSFNDWFVGVNIGRQLGPHGGINFNYGLQKQDSPGSCPVASCGGSGYQHTFGATVNWHFRHAG